MFTEKFVSAILKNRLLIFIFSLAVIVAGVYSYYIIPKSENPNTTVAAATITTVYPGASPTEIEEEVTDVLEEYLESVPSIDYYTSMSINNVSAIAVVFDIEVTIEDVESDLRQSIEDAQFELPSQALASEVNTDLVDENQFIISLSGEDFTGEELEEYAQSIGDEIMDVEGIETVVVDGLKPRQLVIETDVQKMSEYGLSNEALIQIVEMQNYSLPSGSIVSDGGTVNVITDSVYLSIEDIEKTIVGSDPEDFSIIRIEDVAEVFVEEVEEFYYSQDGNFAILITGTIVEGVNAVNVGDDLRKALDNVKEQLPENLVSHEILYAPQDIDNSINNFISSLFQSVLLVVVVVMLGVHFRNGIIVSIAIPLSILMTFIVMNLIGVEFHFISIAGLVMSLGILVDNSIVISEAIQHKLNAGMEKLQAVIAGVKETAIPVLTSTLTTIVTFSIIYFVPGAVGQVAGEIPTVVIISLVASYLVAMCVTPLLAFRFFKPETVRKKVHQNLLKLFFEKLLSVALRHRIITAFSAFLTLGIAALLALQLGMRFFPVSDKPIVYINFEGDTISLEASTEIAEQINEVLDEQEIIDNYAYAVGNGLPNFFLTVPTLTSAPNVGQYMLQLNEDEIDSYGNAESTAQMLQDLLNDSVKDATITVRCLEYSLPTEATITMFVSGADVDRINEVASEMTAALEGIEGTHYVRNTIVDEQVDYRVVIDRDELEESGIQESDVTRQINTTLLTAEVGYFTTLEGNIEMVIRSNIQSLADLEDLEIISTTAPVSVTLSDVADIEEVGSVPIIEHYNGQPYVTVLSDVLPGFNSISIESELNEVYINDADLTGLSITGNGEVSNMTDLLISLIYSSIVAVTIIYLILIFQFKDLKRPLIVLASIPLSFIGCGFGLWIFRLDIQATALLGLVSLFGIVVNNSILLIEEMKIQYESGLDVESACINSVEKRFRPIMLSSVTTIVGLIPLILAGDPMTSPMATVLMFGLLFSTILTMVVVPTLFAIQHRKAKKQGSKSSF